MTSMPGSDLASSPGGEAREDLPMQLEQYLKTHGILIELNNVVNELLRLQPDDPFLYMIDYLYKFTPGPAGGAGGVDVAQLESLEREKEEMRQRALAAEEASRQMQIELERVNAALKHAAETTATTAALKQKNEALDKEVGQLRSTVTSQTSQIDAQTSKVQTLSSENRSLKAKLDSAGARSSDVARLQAHCKELRKELTATKKFVQASFRDNQPLLHSIVDPVRSRLASSERLLTEAFAKYNKEVELRKTIYNQLQELRGNIRVYCRMRPVLQTARTSSEDRANGIDKDFAISFPEKDQILVPVITANGRTSGTHSLHKKVFEFDRVFSPDMQQEDVFADTKPLVTSVVDGYNVCIFAYGQTGSGKTYTMEGPPDNPGVNYRALEELFNVSQSRSQDFECEISVSLLEIYNEQIRDLLDPPGGGDRPEKKLEIRSGPEGNYVPDVVQVKVLSVAQVSETIQRGSANRAIFATNINEHSSRSHCILSVRVHATNRVTGVKSMGKLNLVDLAGSERISKTEATGSRLEEAKAINKSLSALGDVIQALVLTTRHVPYRNSKLTHLLQDSLGGHSKVLMFVQISPDAVHRNETTCSLVFASRVRGVELGQAQRKTVNDSALPSGATTSRDMENSGESRTSHRDTKPPMARGMSARALKSTSTTNIGFH